MGVKLQLVLGVVLVFSACRSTCTPTTSTTPQNVPLEIPDRHLNLIEKSPKTDTEQKNVNSNTQKNFTSVKLNKSEPYLDLPSSSEDGNKKGSSFSNNVVEKEHLEQDKENTIKQDGNREDSSRSIDVNVQKYISPEFHSKNVFTLPISSDTEKYIEHVFSYKTTTEKLKDFANMVLTTPRHDYFDSRFKEAVQSIDQKLEHLDTDTEDDEDDEDEDEDSSHQLQIEKLNYRTTPNSNVMDYKEMKNIRNNTMIDKNSAHKDMVIEQVKRLNVETSFNDTQVYDDDDDKDDKFLKGDTEKLATTTPKNNFILTTRKSVSLTKPPLSKNNSYILNNKIETETFKAINIITTELPTTKKFKGDDENVTTSADVAIESSTREEIKTKENQIMPVETDTTTVGKIITTPNGEERLTTTEGVNKKSVNVEESITTEEKETTDIDNNLTSTARDIELNIETTEPAHLTTTVSASENSSDKPNMETSTIRINEDKEKTTIEENLTSTAKRNEYNIETTDAESLTTTIKVDKESAAREELERTTAHVEVATDYQDTTVAFTTATTPLKSAPETTTNFEQKIESLTEELATTVREELITARDEPTTTYEQETTTAAKENSKIATESIISEQAAVITTTDPEEIEATSIADEKTSEAEIRTTETGFRTSKSMSFSNLPDVVDATTEKSEETTTANPEINKTTIPTVTEIIRRSTTLDATEGTTDSITATPSIPKIIEITDLPTSTVEFVTTTPRATTTTLETTETFVVTITSVPKDIVTEVPTTTPTSAPSIPTIIRTSSPDTVPTTENINQVIHHTDIPTTPSATIDFIHIKTIDENHTTLVPETLNPGFNYSTPVTTKPIEERKIVPEEPVLITTTEFEPEGTITSSPNSLGGDPSDDKKGTIAAIVISTVAAVCLVILAGLLYVMRKRQKRFNYGERCRPVSLDNYSVDNVSVYNSVRRKGVLRASKRSYGNPAFDDPVAVTHPLNFPALAKFASNTDDIKAEFEEIPQIAARTSELPEGCETKNRYANVIPLPETRVFLKPIDGYPNSDYINANYVTGPKDVKGYYIATQAPMQNTVDDFWRMIWEQQSKVILMITHFIENGVEKCVDYLPPSEVLDCHRLFGDFQITLKKREVKDKYIISSLQLKNMVSNSWREVTHFWYMGWPEKGVPTEPNSLIAFLIEARSFMKSSTLDKNAANGDMNNTSHNEVNPVVVHCSPGTGRTGVVVACDIAIREFEQSRLVDIPKIVYRIRRDRASAVQTKEQYSFIYKVVSLYATKLTGGALDSF